MFESGNQSEETPTQSQMVLPVNMRYVNDDGGRAETGFRGAAGDCAVRSIAIATGQPYLQVYHAMNEWASLERPTAARASGRVRKRPRQNNSLRTKRRSALMRYSGLRKLR